MLSSLSGRKRPCSAVHVSLGGGPTGPIGLTIAKTSNEFSRQLTIPKACLVRFASMKGSPMRGRFSVSTGHEGISLNGVLVTRTARVLGKIRIMTRGPLMGTRVSGIACDVRSSPSSGAGAALRVLHGIPLIAMSKRSGVRMGNDDGFGIRIGNGPGGVVDGGPARMLQDVPTGSVGSVRIVARPKTGCSTRKITNVLGVVAVKTKVRKCAIALGNNTDGAHICNNNCNAIRSNGFAIANGCSCGCRKSRGKFRSSCHRSFASRRGGFLRSRQEDGDCNGFRFNDLRKDCRVSALGLVDFSVGLVANGFAGGEVKGARVAGRTNGPICNCNSLKGGRSNFNRIKNGVSCRRSFGGGKRLLAFSCHFDRSPGGDRTGASCRSALGIPCLLRGRCFGGSTDARRRATRLSCAGPVGSVRDVRANVGCVFHEDGDSNGCCLTSGAKRCGCSRSVDARCSRGRSVLTTCLNCRLGCGGLNKGTKVHCRRAFVSTSCGGGSRGFSTRFSSLIPSLVFSCRLTPARDLETSCGVHVDQPNV